MERYIDLTERDSMTNYFHMLRDGHIAYYCTSQVQQFVPLLATGMGKHQLGNEESTYVEDGPLSWSAISRVAGINGKENFQYGKDMKLPKFRNIPNKDIGDYAMTILKYGDAELIQTIDDEVNMTSSSDGEDLLFDNELFGTE
eukprot:scaffold23188_cov42-Cyclotella_meneghiniana.AAC.5